MPPNTPVFLLGLAVGTILLVLGLLLGYWFGRRAVPVAEVVDRQQFLSFLRNLSNWTNEFSGNVTDYQNRLSDISERVQGGQGGNVAERQEIGALLSQIMEANRQLQNRLDTAEQKLELQTDQISNYLTEARTDGLTGLFNRRAFDKAMDELFADWNKKRQTYSLGLIDIDHFKHINDTYGHPAGDTVLKRVASLLQSELGSSVCVARYGGEEFAVLSLAPKEALAEALDQLRAKLSVIEVHHEEMVIKVSLSAGVAQILNDDKVGKLVRRADEALYAAKLGGRNRVYIHDGTVCHLITQVDELDQGSASSDAMIPMTPEEESATKAAQERIQERLQRIVADESRRVLGR